MPDLPTNFSWKSFYQTYVLKTVFLWKRGLANSEVEELLPNIYQASNYACDVSSRFTVEAWIKYKSGAVILLTFLLRRILNLFGKIQLSRSMDMQQVMRIWNANL